LKNLYLYNGQPVSPQDPIFSASSRVHRYGDGFFETMRFFGGRLQHSYHHEQRVLKSLMLLKMQEPDGGFSKLEQQIEALCASAGVKSARVRVSFLREADGFYTPKNQYTSTLVEILELDYEGYPLNHSGLILGNYKELSKNSNFLSFLKTSSSLIYVMAGIHAKEQQWDDCIIYNEMGRVCETVSANIFCVSGDFIVTPPLSEYCIDGVMRKTVMDLARSYGYDVVERELTELDLSGCREIFLTSAAMGIQWVGDYMGKKLVCVAGKVLSDKLNSREV
jgi:branched-chain amino acid aminotransferase